MLSGWMLLFAVSALEKASRIPPSFWFKVVGGILAFLIVAVLLRKLLQVNKFIIAIVAFVFLGVVGFSWIYNRNEPAFLTPLVDRIAPFFPSKGGYEIRQADEPGATKKPASTKPAKSPGK